MKIGIIGSGYVGLVTGVMLSSLGHEVICIDKDIKKVEKLSLGDPIIYEKDLSFYLKQSLENKNISFSNNYELIRSCEAVFICVGTPPQNDGKANLAYVYEAVDSVARYTNSDCLIIIKSTVTPGTANLLQNYLKEKNYTHKIASNPEFLREGTAVFDFQNPDRIIVGGHEDIIKILEKIYEKQINSGVKLLSTDLTTSEMIKYSSNSFLAVKLSFINEMANLCEKIGANIDKLSEGMGLDKRIGNLFLKAGPGYGGSCFPKDTSALLELAKEQKSYCGVLNAAIDSNLNRYILMKEKISKICGEDKNLAILGVAFKAGTDDIRESPSVHIIKLLSEEGYKMKVFDPVALNNFKELGINNTEISTSAIDASKDADAIVILTEWPEFSKLDLSEFSNFVRKKKLIDLRRIIDQSIVESNGFRYFTIGKREE